MISKRTANIFCKDYYLIENYQQAVNDLTQTWDCHHRREITENKSKQQLIDEGRYYDISPDELIFLTKSEHRKLHLKGKRHSAETKRKMSESQKGKHNRSGKPKKPVMCIETGEIFESVSDAARHYNLFDGNIVKCCNGKYKSCGGFHWKWA